MLMKENLMDDSIKLKNTSFSGIIIITTPVILTNLSVKHLIGRIKSLQIKVIHPRFVVLDAGDAGQELFGEHFSLGPGGLLLAVNFCQVGRQLRGLGEAASHVDLFEKVEELVVEVGGAPGWRSSQ